MTKSDPAAALCPLCGAPNQCAVAAGLPPESCWCQGASMDKEALARAAEYANSRCLCPACGQTKGAAPLER